MVAATRCSVDCTAYAIRATGCSDDFGNRRNQFSLFTVHDWYCCKASCSNGCCSGRNKKKVAATVCR